MAKPTWITKGGDLGIFPELEFFSLPLEVYEPTNTTVTFTFLSGELPPGIQVVKSGTLQGVPVVLDPIGVDETRTYKFTIRASAQTPVVVVDRTFSFTVSNVMPPQIVPETARLGEFFDGAFVELQLRAIDENPSAGLFWTIKEGELPPGINMSSTGLLSGFIRQNESETTDGRLGYDAQPNQVEIDWDPIGNVAVPAGKTTRTETQDPVYGEEQRFEEFGYDFSEEISTNKNYTFTVQVYDGANYDTQTYTIKVIAKSTWKTDNDLNTVDDDFVTTDADYKYDPFITTVGTLPVVRQNSNIAFKFDAIDFYNSELTWSSNNIVSVLGGDVTLDANTGWLTGHIGAQPQYTQTYTFHVTAANVYSLSETYSSLPLECKLTVLGDVNNQIVWNSPADLGTMINGAVSEFFIDSEFSGNTNITNPITIEYKLMHGTLSNGASAINGPPVTAPNSDYTKDYNTSTSVGLPQGLYLDLDGLIVGRTSFRYYRLDSDNTTFDRKRTTFDSTYKFKVQATAKDTVTNDVLVSDYKEFTIKVNNLYTKPYENLYIKALTTIDERRLFRDILSDTNMFPDESIYRVNDPNFGKAKDIKFLDLAGIAPSEMSSYAAAIEKNHYRKKLNFTNVKTAIATDPNDNYAVKYEVVYLDVFDTVNPESNDTTIETNLLTNSRNRITNPYISHDGSQYSVLRPNSFNNMQTRIETALGYSARGVLPDWMTSVQEDKTVLGFKRAVVLAYTKPGESKKIAYRIKNRGIDLNIINFVADRYVLDNTLTENYNISDNVFTSGRETTFDHLQHTDVYYYNYVSGGVSGYNMTLTSTYGLEAGMVISGLGFSAGQTVVAVVNSTTIIVSDFANGIAPSGTLSFSKQLDTVNYAVEQPFASINNMNYYDFAGIDGVANFESGDRLIFAKQEDFNSDYYNDGWINYSDVYIGNYTGDSATSSYYDTDLFDGSHIIPGYEEKLVSDVSPELVIGSSEGSYYLYVPYLLSNNYTGKLIENTAFIDYGTLITNVQPDNSHGSLCLKLTLSNALTNDAIADATVHIKEYFEISAVTDNTITVSSGLPGSVAEKLEFLGYTLTGYGIPSGTIITKIVDDVITVRNPNDTPLTCRPIDLIGYTVSNQRAGIWEINIAQDGLVTLEFVKEVDPGKYIKVLDGRSNGYSLMKYSQTIETGDTVPKFQRTSARLSYSGSGGGRTSFDGGKTKFIFGRDAAGVPAVKTTEWQPYVAYKISDIVSHDGRYYKATKDIEPYYEFVSEISQYSSDNNIWPPVIYKLWEMIDITTANGDKYLKFPQNGVFK